MINADLHLHSTFSDGSEPVEKLIVMAKCAGLTHIAFTDHDMLSHNAYAAVCGKKAGITVVPGIEISAYDKDSGKKAHILGYGIKSGKNVEALCEPTRRRRNENCLRQIRILRENGYPIKESTFSAYDCIFKQQIMNYLVQNGVAESLFGDFYRAIFKNGGICDFDIEYADVYAAVRAVTEDGGIAVLAHPGQQQNFDLIEKLLPYGLAGAELNHPANSQEDKEKIAAICEQHELFVTGGSDYHGIYEAGRIAVGDFTIKQSVKGLF